CLKTAAWLFAFALPAWKLPTIAAAASPPMSNRPASQMRPRSRAIGTSSWLATSDSIPKPPYTSGGRGARVAVGRQLGTDIAVEKRPAPRQRPLLPEPHSVKGLVPRDKTLDRAHL